jgi:phosphoglycolate phosphatase/putative hydrolase of the HAD superfamily
MDIKIAIYSDYKAEDKLKAMGLKADLVVSSTDSDIDRLKPDPAGLFHIVRQMNVLPQDCLFIGDRPELDGVCAEQAGMPCLIVEKKPFDQFDFFHKLLSELKMPLAKSYLI